MCFLDRKFPKVQGFFGIFSFNSEQWEKDSKDPKIQENYHTYNFITGGAKAATELFVKHQIATDNTVAGLVVVDSLLIDTKDAESSSANRASKGKTTSSFKPKTGKVLERSRWFVPVPLVNLILRSVAQ